MSHRRFGAHWFLLIALFSFTAAPAIGEAQERAKNAPGDTDDPRALFIEGERRYAAGQYEQSIELWTRAYELSGLVALQYNIAQAHGRLGQVVEEREALARFILADDSPDDLKDAALERLAALDERIARTALLIDGDQESAEIYINDERAGELPLPRPIYLEPGLYRVVGKLEGFSDAAATTRLTPGEQLRIFLEFEAIVTRSARRISPAAWALWGGGGAALVTGAIVGGLALGKSTGAERGSPEAEQTSRLALASDITIGVGAAAILGGIITQVVYKKRARKREQSLALQPRLGGAAFTLEGEF